MHWMHKFIKLACVFSFILIPLENLKADSEPSDDEIVQGYGRMTGYYCEPGIDNPRTVRRLQAAAVKDAELNCPWVNGRPEVIRVSDWTISMKCHNGYDSYYGEGDAYAYFRCLPK